MTLLVLIVRLSDGLMLSEAMDNADGSKGTEMDTYRSQAKQLFKTLSRKSPTRMTVETGTSYYFCYIIESDVVYLTLCEKQYPKKLAIKFLEELHKEFDIQYGADVPNAKRPYAFIKFDTFIQKTRKVYSDTRSQQNLHRVTEDLTDVHKIMSKNIIEILGRGERIEGVAKKSDELLAGAQQYANLAKQLNVSLFLRRYGFAIVVVVVVLAVVYLRYYI